MLELIEEMTICLVIAIALGFLIGWLFAKALESQEYDLDEDEISRRADSHNLQVKELELKYEKEKESALSCKKKNSELKDELMKKMTLLDSKEAELMEFETVLVKAEETIEKLRGLSS